VRAIGRTAALAALAGAGALAGLLAPSPSPGATAATVAPSAPLIARANFDPSAPAFGDRISATITVEIDRRRARAQTLHLSYDLAPLQPIGPARAIRVTRGDVELMTIAIPVACISDACLAAHGISQLRLAPAKASIATATGVRSVSAAWPSLAIRDRVRSADVNALQPPVEADASPLPPTYRASPATLATIIDIAAVLLGLSAVGLAAWELLLARRRRRAPEVALARAIRLARSAQALPGPERRRALELLARALGRSELHRQATRLAWSEPTPEPDELELLVEAIEREETV
jgi:hypothetical protein